MNRDFRSSEQRLLGESPPLALQVQVDALCEEFVRDLQAGQKPRIETFLDRLPAARNWLLRELLA
jgi:hypothetical protein